MRYSIGEVAKITGITVYTLRYYDKKGLLPFVKRSAGGAREFDDADFAFLRVIDCLKNTGMTLSDIRTFIRWAEEGDASLQKRYDLFCERKKAIDAQMERMEEWRACVEAKCRYYREAIDAGTEKIHKNSNNGLEMPLSEIVFKDKEEEQK